MHKKNKHKQGYDFCALKKSHPALTRFVIKNQYNNQDTIDFSNSGAVKALNLGLLKQHYQIDSWDIPAGYLCPPIPGRVDYIHYLNDLLSATPSNIMNRNNTINALDIGTGASCIYPILGQRTYGWNFTASDIDPVSINEANKTLAANQGLTESITCRLQTDATKIFTNIIKDGEFYHLTLCNPPFHKSLADASAGSQRKWKNLNENKNKKTKHEKVVKPLLKNGNETTLNFGGQKAELWCDGGELAFIRKMINESKKFQQQVLWFTCLVSKKDNLSQLTLSLKKAKVAQVKVINMTQGQKISRFIAWTFNAGLTKDKMK